MNSVMWLCMETAHCFKCGNNYGYNLYDPVQRKCPYCEKAEKESKRIREKVKRSFTKIKRTSTKKR